MRSKLVPLMMAVLFLALCLAPFGADAHISAAKLKKALGDKIKHIVVLMEENRSYDHLMGWYPRGNGLNGTEYQLLNVTDPNSKKAYVNKDAPYVNFCDPNHGVPATTYKLFGPDYMDINRTAIPPPMDAFAMWELDHEHHSKVFCGVIDMFDTTKKLPVLTALADEYLMFDRMFASVPGPTWPNREFFMSATSAGLTETFPWFQNKPGQLYPQKTIFDQVAEAGAEWKLYYQDTPWELMMESLAHNPEHLHSLDQFYEDCASGDLPSFSFINPRGGINITTGEGSNDDHPDHDVALAEAHYKNVYEAIRASPAWNETLFVLTFDEHGGFYDHVSPPSNVPPPDNYPAFPDTWFRFDRLGIRIPTILISPWIKKGQIVSEPPSSQKPESNSEYDLTSIIASSRKILKVLENTPPLTHRDAWVATWEHVLDELEEPRTDCPMTLPNPPPPSIPPHKEAAQPVNELQSHMMEVHSGLLGEKYPTHIKKQGQVAQWLQEKFNTHKANTAKWKASKLERKYDVILVPWLTHGGGAGGLHEFFLHLRNNGTKMVIGEEWDGEEVCLDGGPHGMKSGNNLTVTKCYPSMDPTKNRDKDQQWTLMADATLRPYTNHDLCVTNHFFGSNEANPKLYLEECRKGAVEQHYLYNGDKGWNYGDGILKFMLRDTTKLGKK